MCGMLPFLQRSCGAATSALVLLLAVVPVAMAESGAVAGPDAGPRAAVSRADCERLVVHRPSDDATFTPGVDVDGNGVAPADLPGEARIELPKDYDILVEVNVAKLLGLAVSPDLTAELGLITVRGDRAWYNGQPLQSEARARLAALCRERLQER